MWDLPRRTPSSAQPLSGCSRHPLRPCHTLATRSVLCQLLCGAFPLGVPKCRPATRGYCGPQGWHLAGEGEGAARPRSLEPPRQPQPLPRSLNVGVPGVGGPGAARPPLRGPVACPLVAVAWDTRRGHVECGRVSE